MQPPIIRSASIGVLVFVALVTALFVASPIRRGADPNTWPWQTYANETYGYTIEHPAHWYVRAAGNNSTLIFVRTKELATPDPRRIVRLDEIAAIIGVSSIGDISSAVKPKTASEYLELPLVKEFLVGTESIGKREFLRFEIPDNSSDIVRIEYRLIAGERVFSFSAYPYGLSETEYSSELELLHRLLDELEIK